MLVVISVGDSVGVIFCLAVDGSNSGPVVGVVGVVLGSIPSVKLPVGGDFVVVLDDASVVVLCVVPFVTKMVDKVGVVVLFP